MTGKSQWLKAIIFSVFIPLYVFAADVNLQIKIPATTVGVSQTFTYQVEVSGNQMNLPDLYKNPEFSGFKILSGPNVSTSVSMVNFNTTATKTYTWSLLPKKTGKFTISAPEIRDGRKIVKGKPVQITVTEKNNPALNSGASVSTGSGQKINLNDHVILRAVASTLSPYIGEQVVISYKLYFDYQIGNPKLESNNYENFWVEDYDLGEKLTLSKENYKGRTYQVTTIKKIAAYPNKSGKVELPQLVISLDVVLPSQRRSRGFFDDFFDSPFGTRKHITISSNRSTLNVKTLPVKGRPADFSGLIGHFTLSGGINKNTAKTNEALTYRLKLTGRGNLYLFIEPNIKYSNEFEDYPGNMKKDIDWGKKDQGVVTWEQVIIPRSGGKLTIPGYTLNWFDPQLQKYQSKTLGPFKIDVSGNARRNFNNNSDMVERQSIETLSKDIRYLKTTPGLFSRGSDSWFNRQIIFALIFALFSLSFAFGVERYQASVSGNVTLQRQRKAGKQARKRLKNAQRSIHADNEKFFFELEKGIFGIFADRLNVPVASLGMSDVINVLQDKGFDEEQVGQLETVLKTCEVRRYAPGESDVEEREALMQKAAEALSVLIRRLKK